MRFVFAVHGWCLGGFATFCRNLSVGLRARGHEVALLVLPELELKSPPSQEPFDECVIVPRGLSLLNAHIERVAEVIGRMNPEVLLLNDCPYAMATLPFIPQAVVRVSVIHSVAADEVELGLSQAEWCDRVLVVSKFVEQAALARSSGRPVSVCALGVPIPPPRERLLESGGRNPLEIISVGRVVVHQKRMDRVPMIARLLAEQDVGFRWTIVGDGEYLSSLRRELNQSGLSRHFSFTGGLAPSAVAKALDRAQVLVLPSDCEGMPQAMLEAMAHGVIPVASRLEGSTTAVVEHGGSGFLCEPAQATEFAEAILKLANDPALRFRMHLSAAETIVREFSLEAFTQRFLTMVEKACLQRARRASPLAFETAVLERKVRPFRCLGFWRSLRHQTLGQLKRRLLRRTFRSPAAEGALEVTFG